MKAYNTSQTTREVPNFALLIETSRGLGRERLVGPGEFAIMVGPNSVDLHTVLLTVP